MNKLSKTSIVSFYSSIFLVSIIFFKLISIYFGNNPINNSYSAKSQYVSVFPQGWAFFTKSSKEPQLYVFDCNSKQPKLINLRNFSAEYYFGISRKNRILNIEIGNVFQQMEKDANRIVFKTANITYIPKEIIKRKINYNKVFVKKGSTPNFNGKYLFVTQIMLPWNILKRKPDYPSLYTVYPIEIYQK